MSGIMDERHDYLSTFWIIAVVEDRNERGMW